MSNDKLVYSEDDMLAERDDAVLSAMEDMVVIPLAISVDLNSGELVEIYGAHAFSELGSLMAADILKDLAGSIEQMRGIYYEQYKKEEGHE